MQHANHNHRQPDHRNATHPAHHGQLEVELRRLAGITDWEREDLNQVTRTLQPTLDALLRLCAGWLGAEHDPCLSLLTTSCLQALRNGRFRAAGGSHVAFLKDSLVRSAVRDHLRSLRRSPEQPPHQSLDADPAAAGSKLTVGPKTSSRNPLQELAEAVARLIAREGGPAARAFYLADAGYEDLRRAGHGVSNGAINKRLCRETPVRVWTLLATWARGEAERRGEPVRQILRRITPDAIRQLVLSNARPEVIRRLRGPAPGR